MTYEDSRSAYLKAVNIPGRSLTRSKAPGRLFDLDAGPLYAYRGQGALLRDADGNVFIDMICGLGAVSLGYDAPSTQRARIFTHGCSVLSLPSQAEGHAADLVLQHVAPWASQVRFVKTGSEATHAAYRIAKRATGRPFVLMGDWAYHGWHEWCEKRADGTSESFHTQFYRHNEDLGTSFVHGVHPLNVDGTEIAAVFIEPHRWEVVNPTWLQALRRYCDKFGILLVFDEMIYGGRWALGGASEYFGVQPDLACYGKAIGNGDAVACVVGGAALAEHGQIVSGTYSGDLVGLTAVASTLETYSTEPVIATLWRRGKQLQRGLRDVVADYVNTVALDNWPECQGAPVHQRLKWVGPNAEPNRFRFGAEMAKRAVLWHPDVVNVCYAHTAEQIEKVVESAAESLKAMGA